MIIFRTLCNITKHTIFNHTFFGIRFFDSCFFFLTFYSSGTGVLPSLDGANIESPYQLSQDNLYAQLIQDNMYALFIYLFIQQVPHIVPLHSADFPIEYRTMQIILHTWSH